MSCPAGTDVRCRRSRSPASPLPRPARRQPEGPASHETLFVERWLARRRSPHKGWSPSGGSALTIHGRILTCGRLSPKAVSAVLVGSHLAGWSIVDLTDRCDEEELEIRLSASSHHLAAARLDGAAVSFPGLRPLDATGNSAVGADVPCRMPQAQHVVQTPLQQKFAGQHRGVPSGCGQQIVVGLQHP